jgi:hypothetical protein
MLLECGVVLQKHGVQGLKFRNMYFIFIIKYEAESC